MLNELKFVQGSISKKDLLPALTHFVIENRTIRGYNGIIALGAPITYDMSCKPRAEPLIKAIANCDGLIELALTDAKRLRIKSGKFKAFIDCIEGETPHVLPEGEPFEIDGVQFLKALSAISPIIGSDASRPWCEGILLSGQSAYATNNVILVEYWLGSSVPFPVNIPKVAIKEILRIKEPPVKVLVKDSSLSFLYQGDKWIRTQLLDTGWPDVQALLNRPANMIPFNMDIFKGMEIIEPFADKFKKVYFNENIMSTHEDSSAGAVYELEESVVTSIYNIDMLKLLNGIATNIDWSLYPRPCSFQGDRLRGIIVGLKS